MQPATDTAAAPVTEVMRGCKRNAKTGAVQPHKTGLATINQYVASTAANAGQPSTNQLRIAR